MNTIIATLMLSLASVFSFDRDQIIEFSQLPQQAQQFITENFGSYGISFVIKESGLAYTEYKVRFDNGDEIEFTGNGLWEEIDCEHNGIPARAVPAAIAEYVATKHPKNTIEKISRNYNNFEVELENGLEIIFNKEMKAIRYDD